MTVIIPILCVVIALGVIELLSMNTVRRIAFRCEVNMNLTEPDETATLSYRVYNTSSWPIMFVGFSFRFDDAVEVRESEEWKQRYSVSGTHNLFGRELFLLPHRGVKGTVSFSLKQRGVFSVGKVYLETGDFLGLKTDVVSRDLGQTVVCWIKNRISASSADFWGNSPRSALSATIRVLFSVTASTPDANRSRIFPGCRPQS